MLVKIYCITDDKGLNYIGSTKQKYLSNRKATHKYCKNCSSNLLNLNNCQIRLIEECEENKRNEREQYWIDNIKCVNKYNVVLNKEKYKTKQKQYQKKYRETHKEQEKIRQQKYTEYRNSWGGDRRWNNNLLFIDINLFI